MGASVSVQQGNGVLDAERRRMTELMTTPSGNGEKPLPRRTPRGLLPGSWTGGVVEISYVGNDDKPASAKGCLADLFAFGPVVRAKDGSRRAIAWEAIRVVELCEQ